jgi:hypothetical protein
METYVAHAIFSSNQKEKKALKTRGKRRRRSYYHFAEHSQGFLLQ